MLIQIIKNWLWIIFLKKYRILDLYFKLKWRKQRRVLLWLLVWIKVDKLECLLDNIMLLLKKTINNLLGYILWNILTLWQILLKEEIKLHNYKLVKYLHLIFLENFLNKEIFMKQKYPLSDYFIIFMLKVSITILLLREEDYLTTIWFKVVMELVSTQLILI